MVFNVKKDFMQKAHFAANVTTNEAPACFTLIKVVARDSVQRKCCLEKYGLMKALTDKTPT